MFDMFGRVGVAVKVLWDCWGDGGWKVNGFIPLHLRVHTLSLYKFKFKMSLVKTNLSYF